jgi:hypothetical protein
MSRRKASVTDGVPAPVYRGRVVLPVDTSEPPLRARQLTALVCAVRDALDDDPLDAEPVRSA